MSLEDLDFKINVDIGDGNKALRGLNTHIESAVTLSKALNGNFAGLTVAKLESAKGSLHGISVKAQDLEIALHHVQLGFNGAAFAAQPLSMIHGRLGFVSNSLKAVASGAEQLGAAFGLVGTLALNLAAGIGVLLLPLKVLLFIPPLIAGAFSAMFAVILTPLKLLIGMAALVAKGVMAIVSPFLALAAAVWRLKSAFGAFRLQLVLVRQLIGVLPPKLANVVGGLYLLGIAGRTGRMALTALVVTFRLAVAPIRMLSTAIVSILHPIDAAKVAVRRLVVNLASLTIGAARATSALARLAVTSTISGLKSIGSAVNNVGGMIGGKLIGVAMGGAKALLMLGGAAGAWGVKLAADAEDAEIAFTTMLRSGSAAKAVLGELETFSAKTPFQLGELRDAAKILMTAQVPAQELTKRLTTLGDIAAGTGQPIGDFVNIFAKVKQTGKVSLETLNQLAERGVPIYSQLQAGMGVTRVEMLKMISSGAVGFAQLDTALSGMTTGAGMFAGGMQAQSQTVSGLFSSLKDDVSFAAREMGINIIAAFDFKGLMLRGSDLFKSLRTWMKESMPLFQAIAVVVQAAFAAVWEVVTVVFSAITSALGLTGGNWMSSFLEWAAIATWAFKQWPDIMTLAFVNLALNLVSAGNDFTHLFTGVLPALFSWFGRNWYNMFSTAASFVGSVFEGIKNNIIAVMKGVWDYIKSGGTASFNVAFESILPDFKNTVEKLPEIAGRSIGVLEQDLMNQSAQLGESLGKSLAAELDANQKLLSDFNLQQANLVSPTMAAAALPDALANEDDIAGGGSAAGNASKRAVENNAAMVRSSEGQSVVAQFIAGMRPKDDEKKKLTAAVNSEKHLQTIAREVQRGGSRFKVKAFA